MHSLPPTQPNPPDDPGELAFAEEPKPPPDELEALIEEAQAAADADPVARHEMAYLTPEKIEDAARWRRGVEASAGRAGFDSIAEYLEVVNPLPPSPSRANGHDPDEPPWTEAARRGLEFTRLPPEDMAPPPPRLLSPLICNSRTMWFGAQGVGKGVLLTVAITALAEGDSAYIPGSEVERSVRVGILDWEDNEDEWAERLDRMAVPPLSVPYLAPTGPLTSPRVLANVRRWIDGEGVDLVAVDSVIPAAGGADAMRPEAATAYYQALREIERPNLSLAHVPKDKAQAAHPFGSTYWSAPARLIWRVERPDDPARHVIRLVNTKHSRWPPATEFLLEVGWAEAGPLRLRSALNMALARDTAPIIDRIVAALAGAGRPLTAEEIATLIVSDQRTVRRTMERHRERFVDDGLRPARFTAAKAVR